MIKVGNIYYPRDDRSGDKEYQVDKIIDNKVVKYKVIPFGWVLYANIEDFKERI